MQNKPSPAAASPAACEPAARVEILSRLEAFIVELSGLDSTTKAAQGHVDTAREKERQTSEERAALVLKIENAGLPESPDISRLSVLEAELSALAGVITRAQERARETESTVSARVMQIRMEIRGIHRDERHRLRCIRDNEVAALVERWALDAFGVEKPGRLSGNLGRECGNAAKSLFRDVEGECRDWKVAHPEIAALARFSRELFDITTAATAEDTRREVEDFRSWLVAMTSILAPCGAFQPLPVGFREPVTRQPLVA